MILTAHGGFTLKITSGDTTIVCNQPRKGAGVKDVRFGADIVVVSMRVPEMEGVDSVSSNGAPFVVDTPGAYEHRGVVIEGWGVRSRYAARAEEPTTPAVVYKIDIEEATVLLAVGLSEASLPAECLEALETTHILILSVGAPGMLEAAQAHKLATMLEPNIVVPVGWQGAKGGKEALVQFLKESGSEGAVSKDKLSVKMKDIKEAQGEVVVLE
ncbi:MAG: hypothetical protein KatS3mg100_591 [Candidatus Parcubacteria bacterium]|nr:MAG: hypothetical protein KatS3mg100_591 [Candidatus Parcubacteria bacterium]